MKSQSEFLWTDPEPLALVGERTLDGHAITTAIEEKVIDIQAADAAQNRLFRTTGAEIRVQVVREMPVVKADDAEDAFAFWNKNVTAAPWYDSQKEAVVCLHLDTRLNVVSHHLVALGSLSECVCHPREVFREAIAHSAYAIVLMHNHPSGDPSPSMADHALTRKLREAAEILQIKLLDHVIAGRTFFSFREAGIL